MTEKEYLELLHRFGELYLEQIQIITELRDTGYPFPIGINLHRQPETREVHVSDGAELFPTNYREFTNEGFCTGREFFVNGTRFFSIEELDPAWKPKCGEED